MGLVSAEQVRRAWASLAGVDELEGRQVVVRQQSFLCPPGWIGLLALENSLTICVPDSTLTASVGAALGDLTPAQATSPELVLPRLPHVADVLGPALLFYPTGPVPSTGDRVEEAGIDQLGDLIAAVPPDELAESGLTGIDAPASVIREAGKIIAACGWSCWPAGVAHLSVLTHPKHRRSGLGRAVAADATWRAAADRLIPQWRARPVASRQLARSLGLERLGAQLSIRLAVPSAWPGPV